MRHSGHSVKFLVPSKESCTTGSLSAKEADAFSTAIKDQWFYQLYLDELPVWGMVGEVMSNEGKAEAIKQDALQRKGETDIEVLEEAIRAEHGGNDIVYPFLYTTRKLVVQVNKDQIVQVDMKSEPESLERVEVGKPLTFTLEIEWEYTSRAYHTRFDRYLDNDFFKHQIHWFSICNSFMMVLFLSGLVALILLRALKRDYARYTHNELSLEDGELSENGERTPILEGGGTLTEDSGWKQVHGDVFRPPPFLPVFAALLGTGWQLITLTTGVILFAVAGPLHGDVYEARGELVDGFLYCYIFSSFVGGMVSGGYFKKYSALNIKPGTASRSSKEWQGVLLLFILLVPTVGMLVLSLCNVLSIYYGTIYTLPFIAVFKLFLIWVLLSVPLSIIGTLIGRNRSGKANTPFPCRVNAIPRPIPEDVPWFKQPFFLVPLAGVIPFGSIFIELYYILTSLWNYKYYHVYGFLLSIYIIIAVVVSLTSIISTYFVLNAENYHWHWTSFASGASISVYIFLYGTYYFMFKTSQNGLYQTVYYFSYTLLMSMYVGTLCGTFGHYASSRFVRAIFRNVKLD